MNIEITEEDTVKKVSASLKELTMGEIYRSLRLDPSTKITVTTKIPAGAAKVGAFMLACCLLETLSGFCFRGSGQPGFEQICKKYLEKNDPKYKHLNLYGALRCGLMHSYSPWETVDGKKNRLWLTDGDEENHLKPIVDEEHTYLLNLQNFIVDVEEVLEEFLAKLPCDEDKCRSNLIAWANEKGWMGVTPVTVTGHDGNLMTRTASGPEFFSSTSQLGSKSSDVTFTADMTTAKKIEPEL